MSILGYLIIAFAKILGLAINIYTMIVIVAALISWVSPDPYNPIVRLIYGLTRPAFNLVRRILPSPVRHSRIDISPIIVLVLLVALDTVAVGSLYSLGQGFIK
jgi:YggT family protein